MRSTLRMARRQAGQTLIEAGISAAVLSGILVMAFPVYKSIGDAGDTGSTQLTTQAENHAALLRIASELQNASTSAVDDGGIRRLRVTTGNAPAPKLDARSNTAGGFRGQLGSWDWSTHANKPLGDVQTVKDYGRKAPDGEGEPMTNEDKSFGAASGNTRWGRERSTTLSDATGYGAAAARPRYAAIAANSVLTFQRVTGYGVDASGGPDVQWGTPVRYEVIDNSLVRTQDGVQRIVAPFVTGFQAQISDTGTVLVTIVSQKQGRTTGDLKYHANQIEVIPKN